jgi:two-component system, OmpR family, heavy metal sensor histidine kinase CusS
MSDRWFPQSLAVRVTLLCGLIAFAMTGMLGGYFFFFARNAINAHADDQLIGRAEHFRTLVGDARTVQDLRDQSLMFAALLGATADVLILRRVGENAFVEVNPGRVAVPPALTLVPTDRRMTTQDVLRTADHPQMHWVAGFARSGHDGAMVEVLTGHPLESELQMIDQSRFHILRSTLMSIVVSVLLVYVALRHGLRPLRRVAAHAAEIHPINLSIRFPEHDAPRELREMVKVFNAMLDRIAQGYDRLSQFSADLAHEIRTPVGALIGQTQVALNRVRTPAEYQQLLESNLEELNRLSLIVDNILFLARADHAMLDIDRAPLAMADELQGIADYFEGPAEEAGLRFSVQASGTAMANAPLVRRALHNLVVNALRYSRPDTTVRLIGEPLASGALIAVENDGVFIPAEQLERLFDRFYRADATGARPAESSGLGLSIVKAIMDLHRGEARVTCSTSGTIRFELRFPS